ncbi:MAG TPA: hypothetical protein VNX88_01780 [Terriglobales bacterium]|nr:hypothetical protein [Terriglobales bacterium]
MAKGRSTLAVVLLFVWTAAPALRCLVPGETLTQEEQACCKSMGGQCGDSPASDHPCCKPTTSTAQPALATAKATVTTIVSMAVSLPAAVHSLVEHEFAPEWLIDASPPPHRNQANPVLRI